MRFKELIDYSIFVLMAPLVGVSGAVKAINDGEWTRMEELDPAEGGGHGFRAELYRAAVNYERAGTGADNSFEFLHNALRNYLDRQRKEAGDALTSTLMTAVGLSIAMILTMLLGGPALLLPLAMAGMLPLIHYFQVEEVRYDYSIPLAAGAVAGGVALILVRGYAYSLMIASMAFTVAYAPQLRREYLFTGMIRSKIMNSFNELMWSPNPPRPPGDTVIGAEFGRLFDVASSMGAPLFLSKVNRVVYDVLSWMDENRRSLVIYGSMIPIPYVLLCATVRVLMASVTPAAGPFPVFPSLGSSRGVLAIDGVITSILTGKAVHSIGLGVMLIPLFMAIQLLVA